MSSLESKNVQILLVEDEARDLKRLIRGLERFGYQQIETARDAAEAKAKLDEKLFDVIVADMRLGGDGLGRFAVLSEVKKRNITSVVIILTANHSAADTRKAFKEGAWDYLAKEADDAFEQLDKSIQEAITYFNLRGRDQDKEWIEENMAQLSESYDGQYIAVINNRVIAAAESQDALKRQLRNKKYPVFMPIIKKIGTPVADLIALGESARLVFKSSLRWDVEEKKANKDLRFAVLETVAAFLNSEGGTLLIGVGSDGTIWGLEGDLSLEEGQTDDHGQFKKILVNLMNNRISAAFSPFIKVRFEKIEHKHICVVEVARATTPAFMRGQHGMQLYIRDGNRTRALSSDETWPYIQKYWLKHKHRK